MHRQGTCYTVSLWVRTLWAGLAALNEEFQRDSGMNQDLKQTLWAPGLKHPDVGVLSDEFLDDMRHTKERSLAVEPLDDCWRAKLIRGLKRTWCGAPSSQEATDTVFRQAESLSADWSIF